MNLFTYGSLMFDAVWQRLVCGHYESLPASLSGYMRKRVKNDSYPVVFKGCSETNIDRMLYLNITPQEVALLDEFEGKFYIREAVDVRLPDGELRSAETYVLKDEFRHIASDQDWDAAYFASTGIHHFLEQYGSFLAAGETSSKQIS